MLTALWLLLLQGAIGAFDTLYYHEWRARLPARGARAALELRLHAARDFLYAVLFVSLPWVAWRGAWAGALAAVMAAEVVLTLWDFVAEIRVRRELGDVYAGERVTHAVMGILYGAMATCLLPALGAWWSEATAFRLAPALGPASLRWALTICGAGVFLSGLRDLGAALGWPGASWPWAPVGSAGATAARREV